jgi:hypothetical protein
VSSGSSLDKAATDAKAEHVFLDLLRRYSEQGRDVSHTPPNLRRRRLRKRCFRYIGLEKILRGIRPNQITARNCKMAILFSLLWPPAASCCFLLPARGLAVFGEGWEAK